jgi:hypothetical protein
MLATALWDADDYWREKKAAYLSVGRHQGRGGSEDDGIIPMFVIPETEGRAKYTAGSTPYVLSDQDYADTNDDGIPDVVVTRWSVENASDLSAMIAKMQNHNDYGTPQPFTTGLFAMDAPGGPGGGGGAFVRSMADWLHNRVLDIAPDEAITRLSWRDPWELNDTTAALLNAIDHEAVVLVGWKSNENAPAWFFRKDMVGGWQMDMLEPNTCVPLVIGASCYAAYWTAFDLTYGRPVCEEFLFADGRGCLAWTGPTGNSWQLANQAVAYYVVEELYANPHRSMAESWLVAIQRALNVFGDSPDHQNTIKSYVFLGDPVSPFRPSVDAQIASFVRKSGCPDLYEWSDAIAVGCPQGDQDHIVVSVAIDESDVANPIPADAITIGQPRGSNIVFYGSLTADSTATLSGGFYRTTITIEAFGADTCGVDSAMARLYNMDLGYAPFQAKSLDIATSSMSYGCVNFVDLAKFAFHYPSSICDCVPDWMPYWSCVDYVPPDTAVGIGDFSLFASHYQHSYPGGGSAPAQTVAFASGTVALTFEEDYPLIGARTLRASVRLCDVDPFQVMFLSFKNENPVFRFREWRQDAGFKGRTACVDVARNGQKEIVVVAMGPKLLESRTVELGTFEVEVLWRGPLELTNDDFSLQTADVMSLGGRGFVFGGAQVERSTEPVVFRNELAQNYPNPFNPTTTIAFSIATDSRAELVIYDVTGARVRTLVDEHRRANNYREVWDAKSDTGDPVASGVYFYSLTAGPFMNTKKMVLLR